MATRPADRVNRHESYLRRQQKKDGTTTETGEEKKTGKMEILYIYQLPLMWILDPLRMQSLYTGTRASFCQRCPLPRSGWSSLFVRPSRSIENYSFWESWSLTRAAAGMV